MEREKKKETARLTSKREGGEERKQTKTGKGEHKGKKERPAERRKIGGDEQK